VSDALVEELAQAEARLATLDREHARIVAAAEGSNADDEHDPEGATLAFERQQLDALRAATRRRRDDLRRALADVADGTYGSCERCGRPIDPARLAVRPQARTCVGCA
jgi:DnaK suppressor protein